MSASPYTPYKRPDRFANDTYMHECFIRDGHTYTGFIEDLMREWLQVADPAARAQIERGEPPTDFAECVRYALIRTSINAIREKHVSNVVYRAIQLGVWSSERALTLAENMSDEGLKNALNGLLTNGSPTNDDPQPVDPVVENDPQIVEELDSILASQDQTRRAEKLMYVAQRLGGEALSRAMQGMQTIDDEGRRAYAFGALARHLIGEQFVEGLELALTLKDEKRRGSALRNFGTYADGELIERILNAVLAIGDNEMRGSALISIAGKVRGEQVERALDVALGTFNPYDRFNLLVRMSNQLTAAQVQRVLDEARNIEDHEKQAETLRKLLARINPEQELHVIVSALETARNARPPYYSLHHLRREYGKLILEHDLPIEDDHVRWTIVQQVDESWGEELIQKAIKLAFSIENDSSRADAVANIAPYLGYVDETDLEVAIASVREVRHGLWRSRALTALAGRFEGERRSKLLNESLQASQQIEAPLDSARSIAAIARQADGNEKPTYMTLALEAALAISDLEHRILALRELHGVLSGERQAQALAAELETALQMEDDPYRIRAGALHDLVDRVNDEDRDRAIEAELQAARALKDVSTRNFALLRFSERLSDDARDALLREALDTTLSDHEQRDEREDIRASHLADLARHVSDPLLLERIVDATIPFEWEFYRAEVIYVVGGRARGALLERCFALAMAMEDENTRVSTLAGLVEQLDPQGRDTMYQYAASLENAHLRLGLYTALRDLIEAEPVPQKILLSLLDALGAWQTDVRRTVLTWTASVCEKPELAPYPEIVDQIANAIIEIGNEWQWD